MIIPKVNPFQIVNFYAANNRVPESSTPAPCQCKSWKKCLRRQDGQYRCICIHPSQCKESEEEPLCGTNNRTYTSLCKLKATACLLDESIDVAKKGACDEG